jgi:hypothetical protein
MSFSVLFRNECKLILYVPTMYVYCTYSAMSRSPKQVQNCLMIAETSVVIIGFNAVLCEVRAYTCIQLPFLTRSSLR